MLAAAVAASILGCGTSDDAAAPGASSAASPKSRLEGAPAATDGFRPPARMEGGRVVMPVTFVDGSTAEIVADPELGIQDMSAQIFTSGGLGGTDRTLSFRYGDGTGFMHEGPRTTYAGHDGSPVELWDPAPDFPARCPYLVYRFGLWYAGVRTCQDELSSEERESWARLLKGSVTDGGWLVLSAEDPLRLTPANGHMGPQVILGMDRSNWIEIEPGACDSGAGGDLREMPDGTMVTFSRLGGGSDRSDDWTASWCEDGAADVMVSQAYEDFARAAARGFRMRDIVVAE